MVRKVTSFSRLVRPDNSGPIRWMGCWMAVNRPAIQEKADEGGEKLPRHRGAKRRGGRSRRHRPQKRRRLVPARPCEVPTSLPQGGFGRVAYQVRRRLAWSERRVQSMARLYSDVRRYRGSARIRGLTGRKLYDHRGRPLRRELRGRQLAESNRLRGQMSRWAAVSAAASHEDYSFALKRLKLLLVVLARGWDGLRPADDVNDETDPQSVWAGERGNIAPSRSGGHEPEGGVVRIRGRRRPCRMCGSRMDRQLDGRWSCPSCGFVPRA